MVIKTLICHPTFFVANKYIKNTLFFLIFFGCNFLYAQNDSDSTLFRNKKINDLKKSFPQTKPQYFEYNSQWILAAKVKFYKKNKLNFFPTSSGETKEYRTFARLDFKYKNRKYRLYCYQPSPLIRIYKNHLFLPLKDLTAPDITYGGGRYLDLLVSDIENKKIVLNFNNLYNPLCAYEDAYSCPLPPRENTLKLKIEAGEKIPLKPKE